MGKWLMRLGAIVLAVLMLVMTGCPPKDESSGNAAPKISQPPVAVSEKDEPVEKTPVPIDVSETMESLAPATNAIPETKLPETERAKCLVAVGDELPSGEVTTLDGEKVNVADLLGKQGTVVFFWSAGSSELAGKLAAQALADLQVDAQAAYGDQGLAVVAINPTDPADKVKALLGTVEVGYPILLDSGGSYFAKIASEGVPRVYVLDQAGKIVWFDIEFSEVTRETLKRTLPIVMGR